MQLQEGYQQAQDKGTSARNELKANFPKFFRKFTYVLAAVVGVILLILSAIF